MEISETIIVDGTLWVLGGFSLLTWSVILLKAGEIAFNRYRNWRYVRQLREPRNIDGVFLAPATAQVGRVMQAGTQPLEKARMQRNDHPQRRDAWHELIERALRQQILKEKARLDSGLGWLASIGSTAPFVGLFGTVWGIMHALKDISAKGSASLEVVAGPIGEALIATAFGIAVAIPAVIAYNLFLRQNRRLVAHLEHCADDFLQAAIEEHLTLTPFKVSEHGHAHAK